MKNQFHFLLAVLLLASCSFLDEHPRDQRTEEDVVTSEANLYLTTLGNLYDRIGADAEGAGLGGTGRGIYDLNTFTTDEAIIPVRGGDWLDGGLWQRLHAGTWETGEAPIKNAWVYLYQFIVMANAALDDLAAAPQTEQTEAWTAEVKALRAMYYWYLLDLFGNVPYVTDSGIPLKDVPQMGRTQLFGTIVSSLLDVMDKLPEVVSNVPGQYYGRMTLPVAWFVMAKLALNAGAYNAARSVVYAPDIQNPLEAVIYYCDCLEAFGYDLEQNYSDNFAIFNESSVENIFTIPMDPDLYTAENRYMFRSLHYDHAAACGFCGENGPSATLAVLKANGYGTDDVDPRFARNYWADEALDLNGNPVPGVIYKPLSVADDVTGTPDEKFAGARMRKYAPDPSARHDGKLMNNDYVLFRFADVLLMKAEALWRSGREEEALALVNRVRDRAAADPLGSLDAETILRERLVELAWEGWRRQDLIRFDAFGYNPLFPIPADIIALNPHLHQNDGY